jgi:ketosteroid isomerase-like protein
MDADEQSAVAAVRGLYDAIVAADIDAVLDHYADSPDLSVFVEGPRWLTVGYDAVARGWRAFGDAPIRLTGVEVVEGPFVEVGGDLAVVSQIVDITSTAEGAERQLRMRMTHGLRREGGRWRTVHEHASQPLADPYGTGDWLPAQP